MPWLKAKMLDNTEKPTAEVWINGQIGESWFSDDGVTAKEFINTVKDLGEVEVIDLKINSPGGNVADGLAIYNHLRTHKAEVNVTVMSEAASIASVIAMAGDTVKMSVGAIMMIHNPMTVAYGNAAELRKTADNLDVVAESIMEPYLLKTGMDKDPLKMLIDAETYMTGEEAVSNGFADSVDEALQAVASADSSKFNIQMAMNAAKLEAKIQEKDEYIATLKTAIADKDEVIKLLKPEPVDAGEIVNQLSTLGFDYMASKMIQQGLDNAALSEKLKHMQAIKDKCAAINLDPRDLIEKLDSPAEMLGHAVHEALVAAEHDTNSTHLPGSGTSQAKAPDAKAIYAQLNKH